MKFALQVDPNNQAVQAKAAEADAQRQSGLWTCPTTLSEEKTYNVFMRCFDADMQALTGTNNANDCMGYLRQWKNSGQRPNL